MKVSPATLIASAFTYIITATWIMSIHFAKHVIKRTYKETKMPFIVVIIDVDPGLDNGDAEET
jgi:hypothetical protein